MNGVVVALVGLVSAVLGGFMQARATRSFERLRFSRQAKWDLYSAFFVSLGELSFYARETSTHTAALASMAQIRARIALVGTHDVIESVAEVFRYRDLKTDAAQEAMAAALRAMRRDVGEVDRVIDPAILKAVMFRSSKDDL
ncbi:hypothetical protein F9288_18020 [Sphingomonas sp. CL5.1]|uniref:hypothetical protein n=1 Tax=Sphingomonas sp. CL5.1 TaxID=2653203 RepID=UPI0015843EF5|nr:hypothetical protein [Sphingomonas sp. CL5.1]QKS01315.1 hypothetical protein F9288_18020 [Sphingomonas sp. CL5.1]